MKLRKCILAAAFIGMQSIAFACRLPLKESDLGTFLKENDPSGIMVFLGKVEFTKESEIDRLDKETLIQQEIRFKTSRWWYGPATDSIVLYGYTGIAKGTECENILDFSVKPGQEWLIVSTVSRDHTFAPSIGMRPRPLLSRRILNGEVPKDILDILKAHKKNNAR